MTPTYGSLFTGIGGMDLGLDRAGWRCAWQVEIRPDARSVLRKYWPDVPRYEDVRHFHLDEAARVDLICGGDPCQENSRARVTPGTTAPSLGAEFVRVVAEFRPRFVLRENPTRSRTDAPWPWQRFRDALSDLGYVVLPFRLRSCCFGAGHQRDRLFLLAEAPDAQRQSVRLQGSRETSGAPRAVQGEARQRQRLRPDSGPVGGAERRRIDARGGRRDDGLPSRMDRLRSLGNALDPRLSEWIGRALLEAMR